MRRIVFAFLLTACAGRSTPNYPALETFRPTGGTYDIAFWARNTSDTAPVHVYIEGDGHAFDGYGRPTRDPTPRGDVARHMAMVDAAPNVAYVARPCQFVMSDTCTVHDWTDGRFSEEIINTMAATVRQIAHGRPIVLIGYSGGAYVAAQIISRNPDLNIVQWITVAGMLSHSEWTEYFGDAPLRRSLSLDVLPRLSARHYVAERDNVVPRHLSAQWVGADNLIVVPGARHDRFPDFKIEFGY